MNNDTIKLLNLEDINIDLDKSDITKINNILYCNIVLTPVNEHCPECGTTEYYIKVLCLNKSQPKGLTFIHFI